MHERAAALYPLLPSYCRWRLPQAPAGSLPFGVRLPQAGARGLRHALWADFSKYLCFDGVVDSIGVLGITGSAQCRPHNEKNRGKLQ